MTRHEQVLRLLAGMPDDENKFRRIETLYQGGHLSDEDCYHLLVQSIQNNPRYYFEQIVGDDVLTYAWQKFQGNPKALAEALVRARPDIFYGDQAWVTRLVIEIQSSARLGAELGMISIPPRRGGGDGIGRNIKADASLLSRIPKEFRELEVSSCVRELIYWFSRDIAMGDDYVAEQAAKADSDYEREIWIEAHGRIRSFLQMAFPYAVGRIDGNLFPSVHVRWWLALSEKEKRVLNIGDTGTYKTSYGAIAVREAGCELVLVLCAPNARANWERELKIYFPDMRAYGKIWVVDSVDKAFWKPPQTQFLIVGYPQLVNNEIVEWLRRVPFDGLIWDECQYGKNFSGADPAARAVACQWLISVAGHRLKKTVALSATPWENSPEEFAALAVMLRPDLFPDHEAFKCSGAWASPRFLRALFETCILEVDVDEIEDLPPVAPDPWQDLFGAVAVPTTDLQEAIYDYMLEYSPDNGEEDGDGEPEEADSSARGINASQKVRHLLYATDMPQVLSKLGHLYDWPDEIKTAIADWRTSAKLVWLKEFIDARKDKAKFVVGSGLYIEGVTCPVNGDTNIFWMGDLLRAWYGEEAVLILDGSVRNSARDDLIERWRRDPEARILLISQRTCPDSINLSLMIRGDPSVEKLYNIGFSHGWIPWKQFRGRFRRRGQKVPIVCVSPVIEGSVDESRLDLLRRKWKLQVLFRSSVPPTEEELDELRGEAGRIADRVTPKQRVRRINTAMQGRGEEGALAYYGQESGLSSNAEVFARDYVKVQDRHASGHIARFMRKTLEDGLMPLGLLDDPQYIADLACGPGTLARYLKQRVSGIDFNPHMIRIARELAPEFTDQLIVGRLTALPDEWTNRFRLSVCSMALDWLDWSPTDPDCGRLRAMREILRVTEPHGIVWLTFHDHALSATLYKAWTRELRRQGCQILPVSGRVVPIGLSDSTKPAFAFWSICFTPNGNVVRLPDASPFSFAFEHEKSMWKQGGHKKPKLGGDGEPRLYEDFEIVDPSGKEPAVLDKDAIRQTARRELERYGNRVGAKPLNIAKRLIEELNLDWRNLERLRRRGIIRFD